MANNMASHAGIQSNAAIIIFTLCYSPSQQPDSPDRYYSFLLIKSYNADPIRFPPIVANNTATNNIPT